MTSTIQHARKSMNRLGAEKKPFLFIIDFLMQKPIVIPLNEVSRQHILFQTSIASNVHPFVANKIDIVNPFVESCPISFENYRRQFDAVVGEIRKGNSFVVNLTAQTPVRLETNLQTIFYQAKSKYKLWYHDQFVCFSPETFVTIDENKIRTFPMKGTINAAIPNAKQVILNDLKETAEHNTVVDLLRNDLSMLADDVKVTKFRYVEAIETHKGRLLQVSSEIEGRLTSDYFNHLGDILFTLLPAGSITGAPKKKTVEIIVNTESYQRGYYTGVFGVFDGSRLDSAVMIRFIEKTANGYVFKSGGGITSKSNPHDEYQELIDKVYVPIY
ncbi:MAG: aminodeoxychorismate synthase component I [Microbacter sp.]